MKEKSLGLLVTAQTISTFGDAFGLLAMEWLLYQLTGSKVLMGMLVLAFGLPEFVVRFFAAPLIDRVNRFNLMSMLDLTRCLSFMFPVIAIIVGHVNVIVLFVSAGVTGACSALFAPASMAVLPTLVAPDKLVRANSVWESFTAGANLLGPMASGALIAASSPLYGMAADSLSFLLSAILIRVLAKQYRQVKVHRSQNKHKNYLLETIQGFAFFKQAPALLFLLILASVRNMGSAAVSAMFVPFGREYLKVDAFGVGMLESSFALGYLLGAITVGILGDIQNRRVFMLGSTMFQGILLTFLAWNRVYPIAILLFLGIGFCVPFFGLLSSSLYGRLVPDDLMGKVMSARMLVGGLFQPVGASLSGVIAQSFSITVLFSGAGLFPAVLALGAFMLPIIKTIDGDINYKANEKAML